MKNNDHSPLEMTVISGKGGTGKTSITGCFAALSKNAVIADCDVDAANLSMIVSGTLLSSEDFSASRIPVIDEDLCTGCGVCADTCRSDALVIENGIAVLDELACEACEVCHYVCTFGAIGLRDSVSGRWFASDSKYGKVFHARLEPGEENSGKLVTLVRNKAREAAIEQKAEFVIIDGPPGTGCPVISSLAGVAFALVVTEPTLSAIHDMKKVLSVTSHFGIRSGVCINKADLNPENTAAIRDFCDKETIPLLGEIGFDTEFVDAILKGVPLVEISSGTAAQAVRNLWENLQAEVRKTRK